MEARPTPAIEYAPPLPSHRRWVRRALLPLLAGALLVSAYWWGPPFWHRLRLAHAERQCGNYVAAPDTVVFTEDPADVKRLVATPGYRPGPAGEGSLFLVPQEWSKFYGLLSPPGFQSRGTVFLHERRTPAGRRLLVAIDYLGDDFLHADNYWTDVSEFQVRAFEPGGPFSLPVEVQSDQVTLELYTRDGRRETLRLYTGQPDPNDPTHFTITWELTDDPPAQGILDGWVREDGVDLERREAPATPPPPASPG